MLDFNIDLGVSNVWYIIREIFGSGCKDGWVSVRFVILFLDVIYFLFLGGVV